MRLFVRLFVLMLLATFIASTAMQASAAAAMSVTMALAGAGGDMDGCKDCPDGGKSGPSCASLCVMPLMILPAWHEFTVFGSHSAPGASAEPGLNGHSGAPDPYPPRFILLS